MRYLARDMTHPDGGWYSAEDADSEGTKANSIAGPKPSFPNCSPLRKPLVIRHYGITEEGNFEDQVTRNLSSTKMCSVSSTPN